MKSFELERCKQGGVWQWIIYSFVVLVTFFGMKFTRTMVWVTVDSDFKSFSELYGGAVH